MNKASLKNPGAAPGAAMSPSAAHDFRNFVLIAGAGRSGTTLLAKLLDSSPDVLYRHEPDRGVRGDLPYLPRREEYASYAAATRRYLGVLLERRDAQTIGSVPLFEKAYRGRLGSPAYRVLFYGAKALEGLRLPVTVPDLVRSGHQPIRLVKSVSSVARLPMIAAAIEHGRFLHIVRHPCGVIASRKKGQELGKMQTNVFLKSAFSAPEAAQYPYTFDDMASRSPEEQMAFQWMVHNDKAYRELASDERYRLVVYERLCTRLDAELQAAFEHAGIPWGAQTEAYARRLQGLQSSAGGYFSLERPLTSALYRWREQMPKEQIERVVEIVSHSAVGRHVLETATED